MFRAALVSKVIFVVLLALSAVVTFSLAGITLPGGYCHAAEPVPVPGPGPGPGPVGVRPGDGAPVGPLMGSYEVIITRNLFNPGRTEKWKATAGQGAQFQAARRGGRLSGAVGDVILEGIISSEDYRAALVRQGAGKNGVVTVVVVGDVLGAYKVISIEDKELILKGSGGERVLTLFNFDDPARRRHIKTEVKALRPGLQRPDRKLKRVNPKVKTAIH